MENNDQNNNTSNPSSSSGGFLDPSEWEKWGNDFLKEALMGLDNNNMNTMNYDQFDPSLMINNPHPQQTNQLPQQQQEQPLLLDFGNLHGLTMNNPYMDFPCFVSPTSNPNSNPNVPNYNVISNVPNVPVAPSPMVLPEDYQYHQQFQPQQAQATPVEDEEVIKLINFTLQLINHSISRFSNWILIIILFFFLLRKRNLFFFSRKMSISMILSF